MWFTETPWPPILIVGVLAVALFAAWYGNRRTVFLVAIALLLAVCPVIWFIERSIVTPAEEIETALHDLVDAFVTNDTDRAVDHISAQSALLQAAVRMAVDQFEVEDGLRITDVNIRMTSANSRGLCHFRANGVVEAPRFDFRAHHASRWIFTWQREEGQWRVLRAQRLNVMTGDEIDIWSGE